MGGDGKEEWDLLGTKELLEASAAWVCGCAVLAAIAELLPTLNQIPTQDASVVLGDLASAIFLNLCALLWLR